MQDKPTNRLLKQADVLFRTSLSKTMLYNKITEGSFPPPISVGARSVAWVESEVTAIIEAWIFDKTENELYQLTADLISDRRVSRHNVSSNTHYV